MRLSHGAIDEVILDGDAVIDEIARQYTPEQVFSDHIEELHKWARENGYVKEANDDADG